MAKVTLYAAAAALRIPHQTLHYQVRKGLVNHERVGRYYILDLDLARQEIEDAGYYQQRKAWKRARERVAQQEQAG